MNPGKLVTRVFVSGLRFSVPKTNSRVCSVLSLSKPVYYRSFHKITPSSCSHSIVKSFVKKSHAAAMGALSPQDPSSFSRPDLAIARHLSLSLNVDFEKRVLKGQVVLSFDVLEDINEVILDVSKLNIDSVELEDNTALEYTIDNEVPNFGSKLTIKLPQTVVAGDKSSAVASAASGGGECNQSCCSNCWSQGSISKDPSGSKVSSICESCPELRKGRRDSESTANDQNQTDPEKQLKIRIKYSTDPKASALQWLEPSQTAGKKHPYLFSQCQPIHARSIVPCQDTPSVKITYDAEVTAPEEFTVLMSALRGEVRGSKTSFRQPTPMPSYLIAIAVGVLEQRELGPRSRVWTEKEDIERSAWEFAETEKYLKAAENLCGPYVWSQYDLLVLPPSFPYGGMENPCLTFVTPTLLAGDRSQADVIVHEIMHSWTGNLVTNRNFEHFWLNEGFTVFLERKVASSLIADPIESKRSRDFHSLLGLQELEEAVDQLGRKNPLTKLVVNLTGVHPDDAFSTVPYEKGSLFLRYLEDLCGGPEVFDDFLRSYLNKFARKSLDTDQFKEYLLNYFDNNENLRKVDWDAWLYTSGMPPVIPDYDTSMTKAITALLSKIENPNATISHADVKTFTPHQIIHLLQELIYRQPLPLDKLHLLGNEYKVAESKNSEIQYRWLRLCVRSKDQNKLQEVFSFVNQQGRMKYIRPLYRDLYDWEDVREQAINNFLQNEPNMMHVSAYTVRKDLHLMN